MQGILARMSGAALASSSIRATLMPEFRSLIRIVFGFAFVSSELFGWLEKKIAYYAQGR